MSNLLSLCLGLLCISMVCLVVDLVKLIYEVLNHGRDHYPLKNTTLKNFLQYVYHFYVFWWADFINDSFSPTVFDFQLFCNYKPQLTL